MENNELYVLYLKEGEVILFESIYEGIKKGMVRRNYKNGEFLVEYDNNTKDEIIGAEQILFIV